MIESFALCRRCDGTGYTGTVEAHGETIYDPCLGCLAIDECPVCQGKVELKPAPDEFFDIYVCNQACGWKDGSL